MRRGSCIEDVLDFKEHKLAHVTCHAVINIWMPYSTP